MASRAEVARVIGHLKDLAPFGDYVKMLQNRRDETVVKLLAEANTANVESLRGEARAYNALINEIATAIKDVT